VADDPASTARVPVIVLVVLTAIALILGVATGSINDKMFHHEVPAPGDPITVP